MQNNNMIIGDSKIKRTVGICTLGCRVNQYESRAIAERLEEKGFEIKGLDAFAGKDDYFCFHAGSKFAEEKVVTAGGRVLGITAKGDTLKEARTKAYAATEWVSFDNKYMRHDIGKAIDEA